MIDSGRLRERHALMVRLLRLANRPGAYAGGFTSWGEVITVRQERVTPMTTDGPLWGQPTIGFSEHPSRHLGFGHMDKIAQGFKK